MKRGVGETIEWDFRWRRELFEWESEMLQYMMDEIGSVSFQLGNRDHVVWLGDPSKSYSVKSAYKVLTEDSNSENQLPFKKLWIKFVPLKVTIFGWQVFQNRIPSKENLCKRGIVENSAINCVWDCGKVETTSHILFECTNAYKVWMELCRWLGVNSVMHNDCIVHFNAFTEVMQGRKGTESGLRTIWLACI
ncbi:uncharacterized protein LOC123894168 [Trifolium pratense]|uniref:uncharacterized protein LOC123894168 n=1 Tax=Trifolium pratense TaxID=57577 RepID=UPI001E693B60|nr:uncharacterized protein LOC123894168 [Trifolium pratense]